VRVLVDTSVWADFFNGHPSPGAEALAALLAGEITVCTCGLVVTEVCQGLKRERGRNELIELFRQQEFIEPSGLDLFLEAAHLYRILRSRGVTVRSTVDCIIAALAAESGCDLLYRDRDMDRIIESGILPVQAWKA
jgi:predicted nucleic acid-binding protein